MKFLRRILGILVMIAGLLGLVLSLAGLVGVWLVRPSVAGYVNDTISTLESSLATSQKVMDVTADALGSTVDSVDALSTMLTTTAVTVEQTSPIFDQLETIMGDTVPSSLDSAVTSLQTAQQAAVILDNTIKSLENFQIMLSTTPYLNAFVEEPVMFYAPEVPLATSLGELATNLDRLSANFTEISSSMNNADANLVTVQNNLTTMSTSVGLISSSLQEYQEMIGQSKSSLESLGALLGSIQSNLANILTILAVVFSLFFFWLLAAQVVIFSQGRELYHGTADRLES